MLSRAQIAVPVENSPQYLPHFHRGHLDSSEALKLEAGCGKTTGQSCADPQIHTDYTDQADNMHDANFLSFSSYFPRLWSGFLWGSPPVPVALGWYTVDVKADHLADGLEKCKLFRRLLVTYLTLLLQHFTEMTEQQFYCM